MNSNFYRSAPVGAQIKNIVPAPAADPRTSADFISSADPDGHFFRSLEKQGILLNAAQIEAVRHGEGPLLIVAGAGTGKTTVLTSRAGYLLSVRGVQPERLLLLTFTKKAADEMKERVARLPGLSRAAAARVQSSTFHAFFLRLLRHQGYQQEILNNERYKQWIIKQILRELGIQDSLEPETVLSLFSAFKIRMEEMPNGTPAEQEARQVFRLYEDWKKKNGKMDFDDILTESYRLLQRSSSLLELIQERFHYVMADEFQDTNPLQYELLKLISLPQNNLAVVGDDDQTIYSFNGARQDYILNFPQEFPGTTVITLEINYRSGSSIIGLGNEVIRRNRARRSKTLRASKSASSTPLFSRPGNSDEEAEYIMSTIEQQLREGKRAYRDFAILYRTGSSSRAIFELLATRGIPFIPHSTGDQNFYEQWLIKPVIDYMRLSLDFRNFEAIDGMIHTLYVNRDMGMEWIRKEETMQPKKYPLIHLTRFPALKGYQKHLIKERISWIKQLKDCKPHMAIQQIRSSFYDKFLEADDRRAATIHKETMKETLDELESSAKRFASTAEFIPFVDQMISRHRELDTLKKDPTANAISLMTIHRSKGLEFPVVYLIGACETILPHGSALDADKMTDLHIGQDEKDKLHRALEEERRLAYVAITRAKEELYISSPSFHRGKKTDVSRFILEAFEGDAASVRKE